MLTAPPAVTKKGTPVLRSTVPLLSLNDHLSLENVCWFALSALFLLSALLPARLALQPRVVQAMNGSIILEQPAEEGNPSVLILISWPAPM